MKTLEHFEGNTIQFYLIFLISIQVPPGEAVNLSSQAVHGLLQRTSFKPFQYDQPKKIQIESKFTLDLEQDLECQYSTPATWFKNMNHGPGMCCKGHPKKL